MLSAMARSSLVTYAADRHPYQTQAVDILKEALTGMKKQMQDSIVQAQAKVDNADQESELRSSTLEQAKAALEDLSQRTIAAKDALKDDKATLGLTKASQSTAESALESIDAEAASMGEKREMLEAALKEMYEPLKVSKASGAEGRKAVSTLVKIFRDVGFEGGFVDLVPETFRKDPEERGTFDRLLEEHVQRHSAKFIAEAEAAIKATFPHGAFEFLEQKDHGITGNFEVKVNDELVHSKSTMGDGVAIGDKLFEHLKGLM
jgi:hypothetical protein